MRNKKARQSAVDVYALVCMRSELNSPRYHWSFDRLRNAECGFRRSKSHLRHKELDVVKIAAS